MLNSKDRTQVILEKSGLSLSKFATILGKDRRTLAKFIENDTVKELDTKSKEKICEFFRYPFVGGKIKCRKRKIKCRIFATNYLSFNLKLKL
ncbi:hypothetical protein [Campylobacter coli]|uniref:hypothetical protein n=1 Tax=Campylobacter coli TaxID=195 RepID=UPI0040334116